MRESAECLDGSQFEQRGIASAEEFLWDQRDREPFQAHGGAIHRAERNPIGGAKHSERGCGEKEESAAAVSHSSLAVPHAARAVYGECVLAGDAGSHERGMGVAIRAGGIVFQAAAVGKRRSGEK